MESSKSGHQQGNAYDYFFIDLNSRKELPLSEFKGKVLVIVNTASECGFTKQYEGLQKLYEKYQDQGLVVLGVPSNDFGGQEPGNAESIAEFCSINYGISFPMTDKEIVLGEEAHPFYKWAKSSLGFGTSPKWNFHKYLINRKGKLVDYFLPITAPDTKRFKDAIEKCLAEQS